MAVFCRGRVSKMFAFLLFTVAVLNAQWRCSAEGPGPRPRHQAATTVEGSHAIAEDVLFDAASLKAFAQQMHARTFYVVFSNCQIEEDAEPQLKQLGVNSMVALVHTVVAFDPLAAIGADHPSYNLSGFALIDVDAPSLDIERLGSFSNLTELSLRVSSLRVAEAREIGRLKRLAFLAIRVTDGTAAIGDDYVAALAPLRTLHELHLSHTKITDEGLTRFAGMRQLRILDIDGSQITSEGLKRLAHKDHLKRLRLSHSRVDDAIGPWLRRQTSLTHLDLRGTEVSDALVNDLFTMPNLEMVCLADTRVSAEAIKRVAEQYIVDPAAFEPDDIPACGWPKFIGTSRDNW